MKFDDTKFNEIKDKIEKLNINNKEIYDEMREVLLTIQNNWNSDNMEVFIEKYRKILEIINEYINNIDLCIKYMKKTDEEFKSTSGDVQNTIVIE